MHNHAIGVPNNADWPEEPLQNLCTMMSRGTAPAYVESSPILAIGQRCVQLSGFDASASRPHDRRFRSVLWASPGDVLLNSTGTGTIGRSCIFDQPGKFMVDSHVTILRSDRTKVDPQWIEALLRSQWGQTHLESHCYTGSTNQIELSRRELMRTAIPVPSIHEQRRITEILDTLSSLIATSANYATKLARLKSAVRNRLIREIAQEKRLADLGEIITGSTPPPDEQYWGQGLPFVTPAELGDQVDVAGAPRGVSRRGQAFVRRVPKGSLLVVCIGFSYGKLGVADVDLCTNQQLNCLVPRSDYDSYYLHAALEEHILRLRSLSGLQVTPIVNKRLFGSIRIPVPDLERQRSIASKLNLIRQQISLERERQIKLSQLKQGLMEDLLTGRVRVSEAEVALEGL